MDRRAWWASVHGTAESQTRLSHWTHMHTHTHVCILKSHFNQTCGWGLGVEEGSQKVQASS